jgi:hypothetical protein
MQAFPDRDLKIGPGQMQIGPNRDIRFEDRCCNVNQLTIALDERCARMISLHPSQRV